MKTLFLASTALFFALASQASATTLTTDEAPQFEAAKLVMQQLADKDGGTLLSYNVEAQIGGKLAQLGQRLINGAAKKLADEFFDNFAKAVQG